MLCLALFLSHAASFSNGLCLWKSLKSVVFIKRVLGFKPDLLPDIEGAVAI